MRIIHKMQDTVKMKIVYNLLSRGISTCNINLFKYAFREGKFMTKIMRGEQGKRKWYAETERVVASGATSKKPVVPQNNRRNTVLNKIFMKYITDLMATGEVAPDIVGKGIEISRVSVTPDFHQVNVYWLARGAEEKDNLVEETLTRAEGPLRHELSQLRVMGVVPTIKFVRDKQFSRFIEIDRRLANADFGEDFIPTDRSLRLKTIPTLKVKLPQEIWNDIEQLELDAEDNEIENVEEVLPEMRNDVLGLDHSRIMAKVKSSIDKSKAAFKNRSLNLNVLNDAVSKDVEKSSQVTEYLTVKQRNEAFSDFLRKRQLDEKQRRKYEINKNNNFEDELYALDQQYSHDYHDEEAFDVDIHEKDIQKRS